ncbi:MAG: hypothetical protein JTJ28_02340 [Lactobacillus sp.]|nr:hypothetical protein [Lactobacillus sp.]
MHTGFKDKNHIYAMEVLNDGEWVLGMYDVPIDIASIKKISEYYNRRGYANNQIRIVKVF